MQDLGLNVSTVILLIIILALAVLAIRRMTRRGLCDCGGDCDGGSCHGCSSCSAVDDMVKSMDEAAKKGCCCEKEKGR